MEYLTITEASELLNLSKSRIRQLVCTGKYQTTPTKNARNKTIHSISLDQFTEEQQQKYYQSKGILNTNIEVQNAEKLEFMSTQEREECVFGKTLLMNGNPSGIKKTQEIRVKLMNYSSQR